MKYAIISDIHGNLPALEAVLHDAQNNDIDAYIFAGDYCLSNPFPNECLDRIRNVNNIYIIRGNEESYLENLVGKDQSKWTDGQMQISYYCYRAVSEENLNYVINLPHKLNLNCHGIGINIAHSSATFLGDYMQSEWNSAKVAMKCRSNEFINESLSEQISKYINDNQQCRVIINNLEPGVYIFGHSHLQWSWQLEDGRITLINPGSCGLPLDGKKNSIPYTILEITDDGLISVDEKRLPVDTEKYIHILRSSDQFKYAAVWSKIIEKELRTGLEHLYFFLCYVEEYANKIGDKRRPYAVDTWENAYELWEAEFEKEAGIQSLSNI